MDEDVEGEPTSFLDLPVEVVHLLLSFLSHLPYFIRLSQCSKFLEKSVRTYSGWKALVEAHWKLDVEGYSWLSSLFTSFYSSPSFPLLPLLLFSFSFLSFSLHFIFLSSSPLHPPYVMSSISFLPGMRMCGDMWPRETFPYVAQVLLKNDLGVFLEWHYTRKENGKEMEKEKMDPYYRFFIDFVAPCRKCVEEKGEPFPFLFCNRYTGEKKEFASDSEEEEEEEEEVAEEEEEDPEDEEEEEETIEEEEWIRGVTEEERKERKRLEKEKRKEEERNARKEWRSQQKAKVERENEERRKWRPFNSLYRDYIPRRFQTEYEANKACIEDHNSIYDKWERGVIVREILKRLPTGTLDWERKVNRSSSFSHLLLLLPLPPSFISSS